MRLTRLAAAIRRLCSGTRTDRDLHDELQSFQDLLADEQKAAGVAPAEARRQAAIALGGMESVKESVRAARPGAGIETIWQDARYALRGLRRTPAFTAVTVLTLGLGAGVNAAVFSVVDSTMLKPLPYDRPDELVQLGHEYRRGTATARSIFGMEWKEAELWLADRSVFAGAEAAFTRGAERDWRERDRRIDVGAFTAGMPALLGVRPLIGRVFSPEEADTKAPVLLISEAMWAREFSRSPGVLGSTITLDAEPHTVIGVMPRSLRYGPGGNGRGDAWTAMQDGRRVSGAPAGAIIFRLRPGLTFKTAGPAADAASGRIREALGDATVWTPDITPLDTRLRFSGVSQPLLLILLVMTGLVLAVACANVANLLSARGAARRQEMAMRTALGASRRRLVRLLLVEGAVIAGFGGVTAALLSKATIGLILWMMPPRLAEGTFRIGLPEMDWRVWFFTGATVVGAALLSSLWPALRSSRVGLSATIGAADRAVGSVERRRMSAVLQVVQVALALVLATGAALFGRSLASSMNADLGFEPAGLLAMTVQLPRARYATPEAQHAEFAVLADRIRAVTGVEKLAFGPTPAEAGGGLNVRVGQTTSDAVRQAVRVVGSGYIHTIGARVVAGRDFGPEDTANSLPVAIVDETAARVMFPGESPLGQRLARREGQPERTIIGVVSDVATFDFNAGRVRAGIYQLRAQTKVQSAASASFVVRVNAAPPAGADERRVLNDIQSVVKSLEPDAKILAAGRAADYFETMETFAIPRFFTMLILLFAVLALVTAAVGLYGLLAYSVGQRQREIGVRVALGSSLRQIRALVLKDAFRTVGMGLAIGGIAAWLLALALGSVLYGISVHDPVAFIGSAVVLVMAALVATVGPIRKATGVDPIRALRVE
jgi:putative ABC transport system permease protein